MNGRRRLRLRAGRRQHPLYVKYRTSNGVQRKRRGFRSEREAVRWRTHTMAAVDRGEIVAVRGTFAERF